MTGTTIESGPATTTPAVAASASPPRRILCVFPRYTPSFGMFHYSYPLTDGVKALMPPQGLLVIAAALPPHWEARLVDENLAEATPEDFAWADAVFVSGMHAQRRQIGELCQRAHAAGRTAVLGGPSVSACPEYYPEFDYLHVGEMGDATEALFAHLGADPSRPPAQVVFTTDVRRELADFPMPAYELAEMRRYYTGSVQYSSGCPYQCEFCDIPALYGRNARLKTPEQVCAELDKMLACGLAGAVYFVDDNFIANRRAVREMLPALVDWQKRNGYAYALACEATLNIAKRPEILELMREAYFETVFCGIETPEPEALKLMQKGHNMMVPLLEGVETLNSYGIEVASGIIMGLDTDSPQTGERILAFIEASQIPLLTINLVQALPRTPLWDRLKVAGRLIEDQGERESNVEFLMPYDEMLTMWREVMGRAFEPEAVYARYQHQVDTTFKKRIKPPNSPQRVNPKNVKKGLTMLAKVLWQVGVRADYRATFWRFAKPRLKAGDIESVIRTGLLAHHMILSGREAAAGQASASHYTAKPEVLAEAA